VARMIMMNNNGAFNIQGGLVDSLETDSFTL